MALGNLQVVRDQVELPAGHLESRMRVDFHDRPSQADLPGGCKPTCGEGFALRELPHCLKSDALSPLETGVGVGEGGVEEAVYPAVDLGGLEDEAAALAQRNERFHRDGLGWGVGHSRRYIPVRAREGQFRLDMHREYLTR